VRVNISAQRTIPPIFPARGCSAHDHQGIRFIVKTLEGVVIVQHRRGKVGPDDLIRSLQSSHECDGIGTALNKFEGRLNNWALAELTDIELSEAGIEALRELVKIAEADRASFFTFASSQIHNPSSGDSKQHR
jgi:hypothetical protein